MTKMAKQMPSMFIQYLLLLLFITVNMQASLKVDAHRRELEIVSNSGLYILVILI